MLHDCRAKQWSISIEWEVSILLIKRYLPIHILVGYSVLMKYSTLCVIIMCHNKEQPSKTHLLYNEHYWYYRVLCTWWCHHMETFSALVALCEGNPLVSGRFPSQRPVARALKFALICAWTNNWANNRETGDLRRNRARYDVTVMRTYNDWTTELTVMDKRDLSSFDWVWDGIENISPCCLKILPYK